jgi:hypothetical protein
MEKVYDVNKKNKIFSANVVRDDQVSPQNTTTAPRSHENVKGCRKKDRTNEIKDVEQKRWHPKMPECVFSSVRLEEILKRIRWAVAIVERRDGTLTIIEKKRKRRTKPLEDGDVVTLFA